MKFIRNFAKLLVFIIVIWGMGNAFSLLLFRERYPSFHMDIGVYPIVVYKSMTDCNSEITCLHETGHLIDNELGLPSQSPEFKEAIDLFKEWCFVGGLEKEHYNQCAHVLTFSGVLGNPMGKAYREDGTELNIEWGGYTELYASIYQKWKMGWHYPYFILIFYEEDWRDL